MAYEHYWKRPPVLDADAFRAWSRDVRKVIDATPREVIRDSAGAGEPETTDSLVAFNGNASRYSFRDEIIATFSNRYSGDFVRWLTALSAEQRAPCILVVRSLTAGMR